MVVGVVLALEEGLAEDVELLFFQGADLLSGLGDFFSKVVDLTACGLRFSLSLLVLQFLC